MKKKIVWVVVSCLMVVALVLASCGPAVTEEEEVTQTEEEVVTPTEEEVVTQTEEEVVTPTEEVPKYGGWVNIPVSSAIRGFDDAWVSSTFCKTLVQTNEHLLDGDWAKGAAGTGEYDFLYGRMEPNPIGVLLESWEFPDPDTIILHVKKGEDAVHWALNPDSAASRLVGGREVTAEDIADSITRQFTLPTAWGYRQYYNWWYPDGSATATDDYTVVVKGHDVPVGTTSVWPVITEWTYILPYDVIEKYGDMQDWRNSVGTGPFMLTDYLAGSSATFVRNPNYWRKDPCGPGKGNQLPYVDGVNLLTLLDASTRMAALRTAKIDLTGSATTVYREDFDGLIRANPELQYIKILGLGGAVYFKLDEEPFDDINVRRALHMAIDYQTIKDTYYGGKAEILWWPSPPLPGYMDSYVSLEELPESTRELFEYKPEKAKQLLDEAGYPGPNRFTFSCLCTTEESVDQLSIVKDYWAKIGVDLKIDVRDSAVYTNMQTAKSFKGAVIGGGSNVLSGPFKLTELQCGMAKNYGFCDQYVDDLFSKIWAFENVGKEDVRQAAKKDISTYVLPQAVMVQLPAPYVYRLWWPWVKNYHGEDAISYCGSNEATKFLWIDQDLKEEMTGRR
jgi:peptide/nickel transport system substrate-binding protein